MIYLSFQSSSKGRNISLSRPRSLPSTPFPSYCLLLLAKTLYNLSRPSRNLAYRLMVGPDSSCSCRLARAVDITAQLLVRVGLERIWWLASSRFWLQVRVLSSKGLRASLWCTDNSRKNLWLVWLARLVSGLVRPSTYEGATTPIPSTSTSSLDPALEWSQFFPSSNFLLRFCGYTFGCVRSNWIIQHYVVWTADGFVKWAVSTLINIVTCASVKGSLSPQNIATGEFMLSRTYSDGSGWL